MYAMYRSYVLEELWAVAYIIFYFFQNGIPMFLSLL